MKLYSLGHSGNSFKVRALLALLKLPYEEIIVTLSRHEHKSPAHLARNPRGQIPVLEDGAVRLWDSAACLMYLARRHGGEDWLPTDARGLAEVTQWLALAASEIQFGLQYGRRGVTRGTWAAGNLEQARALGSIAFDALESRLKDHDWLVGKRATIADIACYPYVKTAPEMGLAPADRAGLAAWLARCEALPGWPPGWPPAPI